MLILAGVSINAVVGDNGVLTKAKEASIESKKAQILEELNLKLTEYNINSFIDAEVGAKEMLSDLKAGNYVDQILNSSGYTDNADLALPVPRFDENNHYTGEFIYGVKKEGYGINIYTANDGVYKAEFGEVSFSAGGSVQEGTVLVTKDNFNTNPTDPEGNPLPEAEIGKYDIIGDSNIIFIDPIEGTLSFYVQKGANSTINIFNDMTLTNQGIDRSAIDIEPGGILNIYVAKDKTLKVDSGQGKSGEAGGTTFGAKGGPGGYAGIHCWNDGTNSSVLNLSGEGTIKCFGGNAGFGNGGTYGEISGGRRWRCWCWNRWKWR